MRKIFRRDEFFPLPFWERAGVRGQKILFSMFLIAAGNFAAFGQNNSGQNATAASVPALAQTREKMNISLEREEKFSQPENYQLAHVIFGKDAQGNPIPRILVTARHIEFRDKSGNVIRKIPYTAYDAATKTETHIYTTHYGKNIAVHITHGYSPARESWETGEYAIYDENGTATLRLKPFNDDTMPIPSPSGDYAVGWTEAMMGPPIFYDAHGTRNAEWARKWYARARTGFKGGQPVPEWPDIAEAGSVHFSPDGSHVAVFARLSGPRGEVFVYDSNGAKLFQKEGSPITFSADGRKFFYLNQGGVSACGLDGRVIWTSTTPFQPEVFSADGKLLLARNGPALYEVRAADGHVIWKWEGQWHEMKAVDPQTHQLIGTEKDFGILNLAATGDFKHIAAVGLERGNKQLLIFNKNGRLLASRMLTDETPPIPSVLISKDGIMTVQGLSKLFYLRVRKGVK